MNNFGLYRILGNDLTPRHSETQTLDNLKFILENEPELPDCSKVFVLNRILDDELVKRYRDAITSYGHSVIEIPFVKDTYAKITDEKMKIHYITNVNPARNASIADGLSRGYRFVMPFDGGNIFRIDGWDQLITHITFSNNGYYLLGQWRIPKYEDYFEGVPMLKENYRFGGKRILATREFTIVFTRLSDCTFDESLLYANVDKVELLYRLGVAGFWDRWSVEIRKRALQDENVSKYFGRLSMASWVGRLPSGNREADEDNAIRGRQRKRGVLNIVYRADKKVGISS